jgi:hypothetical protein
VCSSDLWDPIVTRLSKSLHPGHGIEPRP